jgi:Uma2 family endonuclease
MGVPQKSVAYIEMTDYLALEAASSCKHEYLDGVIYAIQGEPVRGMAGGSQAHARIIRNIGYALHRQLQGSGCEVLQTEMRLHIDAANAVFYPDLLVHCASASAAATTYELNEARLVIEVFSPTTQHFDRGVKLQAYQMLAGLQQVVLLSSTEEAGWSCRRAGDGPWAELEPWQPGSPLMLPSLAIEVGWAEVWSGVGVGPTSAGAA